MTRLPFGITVLAGCGMDGKLLDLVIDLEEALMDLELDYYEGANEG